MNKKYELLLNNISYKFELNCLHTGMYPKSKGRSTWTSAIAKQPFAVNVAGLLGLRCSCLEIY